MIKLIIYAILLCSIVGIGLPFVPIFNDFAYSISSLFSSLMDKMGLIVIIILVLFFIVKVLPKLRNIEEKQVSSSMKKEELKNKQISNTQLLANEDKIKHDKRMRDLEYEKAKVELEMFKKNGSVKNAKK